ncbi:MAG TPA: hypothetical protein VNN21_11115 [Dehalococcoidia bacterium]|nr:hypothetical protein [Dehalococcoidia bacterium]
MALVAVVVLFGILATWFFGGFFWPRNVERNRPGMLYAGRIDEFEVEEPRFFQRDERNKFWLVKMPDGSFLALQAFDTNRGCTLPWRPTFSFTDPRNGVTKQGWFRSPCGGDTYDIEGVCVAGPCRSDLNRYPVEIVGDWVRVRVGETNLIRSQTKGGLRLP